MPFKTRQNQLEHRIEELERKLGHPPGSSGGTNSTFEPQFLEIKGFRAWDQRREKGATREDATQLMYILMPLLPEPLRPWVTDFQLRRLRKYSIQVPVFLCQTYLKIWNCQQRRTLGLTSSCEAQLLLVAFPKKKQHVKA